ncbi:MAG: hypothetical protein ACI8XM_002339 [Haloarculaceae archaeon]|jgi:hypothetical protein
MSGSATLQELVAHRLWVYGGGLGVILAVRFLPVPRGARLSVVGAVLAVMVLTYAGEHLGESARVDRPGLLALGVLGVAIGSTLALLGRIAGLAFLAGGLLFVRRALGGDRA